METIKTFFYVLFLTVALINFINHGSQPSAEPNRIYFEKTNYGLIFTTIHVNGEEVKAMIDFGDQHTLQLSSSLTERLHIETEITNYKVSDIHGNIWDVYRGELPELTVGTWKEQDVEFTSQEGEMEAVSQQIGTEFHAVLGWGYFKHYFTEIDYANGLMILYKNIHHSGSETMKVPFSRDANQLIIPAIIDGQEHKLMIDTGSPVTVVDTGMSKKMENDTFEFILDKQSITLKAYSQDLSVLADLGVVAILGGDFLQQWKIIIDPEESVLHFSEVVN